MEEHHIKSSVRDNYDDNEIDMVELFGLIWRTRYIVIVSIILATCLYFAFTATNYLASVENTTYGRVIKLTFPGVEEGKYPNGSVFAYQDIIAPNIVAKVYEKNAIEKLDISLSDFSSMLLAEPYSPQYPLIIKQY